MNIKILLKVLMYLLQYRTIPNYQIAILTQHHFDAQDFWNIFAAKIEIVNSKASITYNNNNENAGGYNWLDVQKLANRCSRKAIYYGRKFLSMDVSCIAALFHKRIEEHVRFPEFNYIHYIDQLSYHVENIIHIINRERRERSNSDKPSIFLIPYRQHVEFCGCIDSAHVVVLVIDLSLIEQKFIYCFDSSHYLIGPNGVKKPNNFGILKEFIVNKTINESQLQCSCSTECTFWCESFMVNVGKYIEKNYRKNSFCIQNLITWTNNNEHKLTKEKNRIINTIGNCAVRWCKLSPCNDVELLQ